MNKARRARLADIYANIVGLQGLLEEIMDEEQEALGNMPESLQSSQRCQAMDAAIWYIVEVSNNLGYAADNIEGVIK